MQWGWNTETPSLTTMRLHGSLSWRGGHITNTHEIGVQSRWLSGEGLALMYTAVGDASRTMREHRFPGRDDKRQSLNDETMKRAVHNWNSKDNDLSPSLSSQTTSIKHAFMGHLGLNSPMRCEDYPSIRPIRLIM